MATFSIKLFGLCCYNLDNQPKLFNITGSGTSWTGLFRGTLTILPVFPLLGPPPFHAALTGARDVFFAFAGWAYIFIFAHNTLLIIEYPLMRSLNRFSI